MVDIRRAIEALVPNAKWDYSVPNEGGTEEQYASIRWNDARVKPTWAEIVSVADNFAAEDLLAKRSGMACGALQFRQAMRKLGLFASAKAFIEAGDEEIQEAWEYAVGFRRMDVFVVDLAAGIGMTDEQLDAVFDLAVTL